MSSRYSTLYYQKTQPISVFSWNYIYDFDARIRLIRMNYAINIYSNLQ